MYSIKNSGGGNHWHSLKAANTIVTEDELQNAISNLGAIATQQDIDDAIAAHTLASNPHKLTPGEIGALSPQDLEKKLQNEVSRKYKKKIRSLNSWLQASLLRQWSDNYNWELSGHTVTIRSLYYDVSKIDLSQHICSYARGMAYIKTKIGGRYVPQWSDPVAADGTTFHYRDLFISLEPYQCLTVEIETASPLASSQTSGSNESIAGIPRVFIYP